MRQPLPAQPCAQPPSPRRRGVLLALAAATLAPTLLALVGCDRRPPTRHAGKRRVVCTTGMIADIVTKMMPHHVEVTTLMGEGVDPHLYKASPGDVKLLESADLVLYNGLHLEGKLADVLEKLGTAKPVLAVAEAIDPTLLRRPPEFEGNPDPHVWFDVSLWITVAEKCREAVNALDTTTRRIDPGLSNQYLEELRKLHEWCRREIASIPAERRVLVTAHDAFGYFGRAYGIEVLAIQGISTDSEASLQSINALVDLLVSRKVPAVFVESSVPRKTIEALVEGCKARGHAVKIGGELFSDAMGPADSPEGTYLGMVEHNVETIVAALGGEPGAPARTPGSQAPTENR